MKILFMLSLIYSISLSVYPDDNVGDLVTESSDELYSQCTELIKDTIIGGVGAVEPPL